MNRVVLPVGIDVVMHVQQHVVMFVLDVIQCVILHEPIQLAVHPDEHPLPIPDLYLPVFSEALSIHPPKQEVEHEVLHDVKHIPIHAESQHWVFLLG